MKKRWQHCAGWLGARLRASVCAGLLGAGGIVHALSDPAPTDAAASQTQALPADLRPVWRQTGLPETALSLVVAEIGGAPLLALNADVPRNPASVMKLVTTWAALSALGPQHVWRTAILTDPGARPDANGVLTAPLYIRASGDPLLLVKDIWALLHALRLRGVRQIGDVVVDRSLFGEVSIDPGAFDGAATRAYNASPDALVLGFGAVQLTFVPDPAAKRWRTIIDPPVVGVTLVGGLQWRDGSCLGEPTVVADPTPTTLGVALSIRGEAAGACGEFSRYRLVLDQPQHAAAVLRYLWQSLGGVMAGEVRAGSVPVDAVRLVEHESPALGEVIRSVNKLSNNLMARMLLLSLGATRADMPATVQTGREVVRTVLAAQGLTLPELVLDNGSGLSRVGRISARSLARLLAFAWQSPQMPEYVSSLAIVGMDGTLGRRLRDGPAQGRAHLKTGSLRDARALAGYVQGASGKRYIVVSLVNHDQAQAAQAFEDVLIAWLARQ